MNESKKVPKKDKDVRKKEKLWPKIDTGYVMEVEGVLLKLMYMNKGKRRLTFTPIERLPPKSRKALNDDNSSG